MSNNNLAVSFEDMYTEYTCCRKNKKNKPGAKKFEVNAFYNVMRIVEDINNRKYKLRPHECLFFCITKRPERILECIPNIKEYDNLIIYCTMENQKRFDERAPIYLNLPLQEHGIAIEPMLERIDISKYINLIDHITLGGESGPNAREMDFEWVKEIRDICIKNDVGFYFHQTGARLLKDGKLYKIDRKYQHLQARKAFKN